MTCPGCSGEMAASTLEGHSRTAVTIDICAACHAFWFDAYESLKLTPGSTLKLFAQIGDVVRGSQPSFSAYLRCPRCSSRLVPTKDRQGSTMFEYWRCEQRHGRFITFFNFLREKSFVKTLSASELNELRQHVQMVNCSNCGGPIDLVHASVCAHCGSPVSILDMKQAGRLVAQLREASAPREIDPSLPLDLLRARRDVETAFASMEKSAEWWHDVSASGLVEAGITTLLRWMRAPSPRGE